jgi:hypothetical protein
VVSAEKRAKQANKRRETRQKKPAKIVSKTVEKAETVELPAEVKPSESEKPPTSLHLVPLD